MIHCTKLVPLTENKNAKCSQVKIEGLALRHSAFAMVASIPNQLAVLLEVLETKEVFIGRFIGFVAALKASLHHNDFSRFCSASF